MNVLRSVVMASALLSLPAFASISHKQHKVASKRHSPAKKHAKKATQLARAEDDGRRHPVTHSVASAGDDAASEKLSIR